MKALKLFLLFVMSVSMLVSCDLYSDMDQALVKGDKLEVAPVDPKIIRDTTIVRDTIICGDTIFVVTTDTIFVEVHDTLVIGDTTNVEKLMYVLQHDVDNQGVAMIDNQYTTLKVNSVDALGTNVAFTANVQNDVDTFFVQNVGSLNPTIINNGTSSSNSQKGNYTINANNRGFLVQLNDGSEYNVETMAESASAIRDGKQVNLLYTRSNTVRVLGVNDNVIASDSVVRNGRIWKKVNRLMTVQVERLQRPLMGPEVVTYDTLTVDTRNNKALGLAAVYVDFGEVNNNPNPGDTVNPNPNPGDTIIPQPIDSGYPLAGGPVKKIYFSYTHINGNFVEALLVQTDSSVCPIISRTFDASLETMVQNPSDYTSAGYYGGKWNPAHVVVNNDGSVSWYVSKSDNRLINKMTSRAVSVFMATQNISASLSDFLKEATFKHEGKTTHVYIDGKYYMTIQ